MATLVRCRAVFVRSKFDKIDKGETLASVEVEEMRWVGIYRGANAFVENIDAVVDSYDNSDALVEPRSIRSSSSPSSSRVSNVSFFLLLQPIVMDAKTRRGDDCVANDSIVVLANRELASLRERLFRNVARTKSVVSVKCVACSAVIGKTGLWSHLKSHRSSDDGFVCFCGQRFLVADVSSSLTFVCHVCRCVSSKDLSPAAERDVSSFCRRFGLPADDYVTNSSGVGGAFGADTFVRRPSCSTTMSTSSDGGTGASASSCCYAPSIEETRRGTAVASTIGSQATIASRNRGDSYRAFKSVISDYWRRASVHTNVYRCRFCDAEVRVSTTLMHAYCHARTDRVSDDRLCVKCGTVFHYLLPSSVYYSLFYAHVAGCCRSVCYDFMLSSGDALDVSLRDALDRVARRYGFVEPFADEDARSFLRDFVRAPARFHSEDGRSSFAGTVVSFQRYVEENARKREDLRSSRAMVSTPLPSSSFSNHSIARITIPDFDDAVESLSADDVSILRWDDASRKHVSSDAGRLDDATSGYLCGPEIARLGADVARVTVGCYGSSVEERRRLIDRFGSGESFVSIRYPAWLTDAGDVHFCDEAFDHSYHGMTEWLIHLAGFLRRDDVARKRAIIKRKRRRAFDPEDRDDDDVDDEDERNESKRANVGSEIPSSSSVRRPNRSSSRQKNVVSSRPVFAHMFVYASVYAAIEDELLSESSKYYVLPNTCLCVDVTIPESDPQNCHRHMIVIFRSRRIKLAFDRRFAYGELKKRGLVCDAYDIDERLVNAATRKTRYTKEITEPRHFFNVVNYVSRSKIRSWALVQRAVHDALTTTTTTSTEAADENDANFRASLLMNRQAVGPSRYDRGDLPDDAEDDPENEDSVFDHSANSEHFAVTRPVCAHFAKTFPLFYPEGMNDWLNTERLSEDMFFRLAATVCGFSDAPATEEGGRRCESNDERSRVRHTRIVSFLDVWDLLLKDSCVARHLYPYRSDLFGVEFDRTVERLSRRGVRFPFSPTDGSVVVSSPFMFTDFTHLRIRLPDRHLLRMYQTNLMFDRAFDTIRCLRDENERLRRENESLRWEASTLVVRDRCD